MAIIAEAVRPLTTLFLFLAFAAVASAELDTSYVDYLEKKGLKAEECAARAPDQLFRWIKEREHVGYNGTPADGATLMDVFYRTYLKALQPYNDAHHAEAAKARKDLRTLFHYLSDTFADVVGHRSYITHERVDAWVEHLIGQLDDGLLSSLADHLDLSVEDAASDLRIRYVMRGDEGARPLSPSPDELRAKVTPVLRGIPNHWGAIKGLELNYRALQFVEDYPDLLEPWR